MIDTMATPHDEVKAAPDKTHRDLVAAAESHLARQAVRLDPRLSFSRALAMATRELARALDVDRSWVVKMRQDNHVPQKHWQGIEEATTGHVKAEEFERAAHE